MRRPCHHDGMEQPTYTAFTPELTEIADVPSELWDIDTHTDGTLYGVANQAGGGVQVT